MALVSFLLILFGANAFLLVVMYAAVQECVLEIYSSRDFKIANKICTIIYIRKIPMYNIMSKV